MGHYGVTVNGRSAFFISSNAHLTVGSRGALSHCGRPAVEAYRNGLFFLLGAQQNELLRLWPSSFLERPDVCLWLFVQFDSDKEIEEQFR